MKRKQIHKKHIIRNPQPMVKVPGLRDRMSEKRISIVMLAEVSTVSEGTVKKAMAGYAVRPFLAQCIESALSKGVFTRN